MMKKIDFESKFNEIKEQFIDRQRKLNVDTIIGVYYGVTSEGYLRISFRSSIEPLEIDSTREIRVTTGKESDNVYRTCFDLVNKEASTVFYSLCADLVDSLQEEVNEKSALITIKNRFYAWKSLFKNKRTLTPEASQGLFGELYFMLNYLFKKYDPNEIVKSWTGPIGYNKDFSLGNTWYEIKAPLSSSKVIVIHSITQLASDQPGTLVVIKLEKMSEKYEGEASSIKELFTLVMDQLRTQEAVEIFIEKMLKYGFDINEPITNEHYRVDSINAYEVNDNFPRLKIDDIKYQEIGKITYELILATLEKYKKEL